MGSMGHFLRFLNQQAEPCGLSIRKVQTISKAATPKPQTHLGQDNPPLHLATQFNDV